MTSPARHNFIKVDILTCLLLRIIETLLMTNHDRTEATYSVMERNFKSGRDWSVCVSRWIVLVCDKLINSSGKTSVMDGSDIWM